MKRPWMIPLSVFLTCSFLTVLMYAYVDTTSYRMIRDVHIRRKRQAVQMSTPSTTKTPPPSIDTEMITEFSFGSRMNYYPQNGTGITVDISKDFDPKLFHSFCKTPANLTAVLPIYSTGDRFKSRRILRSSLGPLARSLGCKIFFMVGVSTNRTVNVLLQDEYVKERDIMVIDKIDTYRDLNNKAFAMIDWVRKHCTNVPYIIHTIDDSFINLPWFLKKLSSIKKNYFMLSPAGDTPAVRTRHKSFVSVQEYHYPRFPVYAYGWVYAFPSRIAARLVEKAFSSTYCWIEDVWIGGHVRLAAGVHLVPVPTNRWKVNEGVGLSVFKGRKPQVYVLHGVQAELLARFYNNSYPRP